MTAYSEALANMKTGKSPVANSSLPTYMVAGDTLNIANENQTFLESAGEFVNNIPKFIATSLISGASQIYNIAPDVGNWFGGDFERADIESVITTLDSDLGLFYKDNRDSTDLVGFMASSLIPGLGGIKILNAGQKSLRTAIGAGKFGTNTGKALGLLAPNKAALIAKATKEVANNSSAATVLSGNGLRAIAAGFGQNALEALAFETAVTVTLFNSPILQNQDFGDFVTNVAFGAGVFGIVGGVLDTVRIKAALKGAADVAAVEARPWQFIDEPAKSSNSYERIVLDYEQLAAIPKIDAALDESRRVFLEQAATTKRVTLEGRVRANLAELSGGDQEVAEVMFRSLKAADVQTQQSNIIGLVETTRFGEKGKVGAAAEKLAKKVASNKASIEEINTYAESKLATAYLRTWGEDLGRVMPESPVVTSLVDTLKKGQVIEASAKGVKITKGGRHYIFNTKFNIGAKAGTKEAGKQFNILRADKFETQARYIWASKLDTFKPTAKNPLTVDANDIPLMEKVMMEVAPEDLKHVKITGLEKGESITSMQEFLGAKKVELSNKLLTIKGDSQLAEQLRPLVQDEIAAKVNVKSSMLSGEVVVDSTNTFHISDMLAMQDHAAKYTEQLIKQGKLKQGAAPVDIWNVPQTIKLTYDTTPFAGVNNFVIENMIIIKQQQKLYQEGTSRAVASVVGEDYFKLPEINSGKVFSGAVPSGAGAGFGSAASSDYGTLAATVEFIGAVTSRMIDKFKNRSREALQPLLYKLGNKPEAAVEWSTLQSRVRAIEGEYGLNAAGDALEPLIIIRWEAAARVAAKAGLDIPPRPTLTNPAMELRIDIKHPETRNLAKAHIELNSSRTSDLATLRTSQGVQFNRSPDAFYPIPIDPKDFPFFATVTDQSITSGNHTKMLYASSEEELEGMVRKLKQNPHLKIRTKKEAEDYFKSTGQFDYEKTMNNNYLDVEAHRKGISSPFIVATDPNKITSDMLNWHLKRESGLVREAVSAKYEVQFEELKRLGEEFTNIGTSKFSNLSLTKFAEDAVRNPFADYVKTALNIRKTANYPFWTNLNRISDEAVSKLLKKVSSAVKSGTSQDNIDTANRLLKEAGYKGATYDADMLIFANAQPARGALTSVIQKANSIMATVVLRWDTLNAVNNAVSANVLLGAETKAVQRAIARGDSEAVGALAGLMNIKVPGTDKSMRAPTKLIANAVKKFNAFDSKSSPDFAFYKDNGYITSISEQYRSALDNLTFNPKAGIDKWEKNIDNLWSGIASKSRKAGDVGEFLTGNKLAEEFNRFVAADVMKQMTDIAVTRNLMTAKDQLAYINTFVNRTQGNYLASQRPMLFQGPIGQAIGLFQTYQFNLMQQLLRHVGEGHSKDAMTLLGLQGTIHGMNGLPAFNALNTHLIGTASGNTEHKDAYDAVYGAAGKEAGDWLMYGVASNFLGLIDPDLKVNLYTRGDINPRQVTLVPVNPASVPIIQATGKVLGNMFTTAKRLSAGGDVTTTLLQGLEHNGISRPLAGLAQTLKGLNNPLSASYSTSKRGNVIASNDFLSLANLGRVLGGKPLDEAIALDATYRFRAYGLEDAKKRQVLGQAIKSTMIAGQDPSQEQIQEFSRKYAEMGGRQEEFGKWFGQLYKTANLSQANEIQKSLKSPFAQSMQKLMGGRELKDFSDEIK